MTNAPPKKRHQISLLVLALALVSMRRFVQRPFKQGSEAKGSSEQQPQPESAMPAEQEPQPESATQPEREPEPQVHAEPEARVQAEPLLAPATTTAPTESPSQRPAAALNPADLRYAVKWVDGSDGADVHHEKRDLSLKQAQREAGWLAKHNRRFYPGEASERSPFSRLQVWVQCVCGRDVVDLREPHTVPGGDRICSYSDSGQSHPRDVILASR